MNIDIKDLVGETISNVGLILLIFISIYVLAEFGNAIAHLGGTQATSIINQGVSTLVFILSIAGAVDSIKLVQWIIRSFGYS